MTLLQRLSKRRRATASILLGIGVMTTVTVADRVATPSPKAVVVAGSFTPANGYREGNRCFVVIGQGGFSQEVPCSDWAPVPQVVRQCTVGLFGAAYLAYMTDGEVSLSSAGAGVGCISALY